MYQVASFLHRELPIRLAHRVRDLESVPDMLAQKSIQQVNRHDGFFCRTEGRACLCRRGPALAYVRMCIRVFSGRTSDDTVQSHERSRQRQAHRRQACPGIHVASWCTNLTHRRLEVDAVYPRIQTVWHEEKRMRPHLYCRRNNFWKVDSFEYVPLCPPLLFCAILCESFVCVHVSLVIALMFVWT